MVDKELAAQFNFSLDELKQKIRGTLSEDKRPVIGISCNHNHVDENSLTHTYSDSVRLAGGTPVLLPVTTDLTAIRQMLANCHGLILTGGGDAHPLWSGEPDLGKLGQVDLTKDYFDYALLQTAIELNIPVLGICRGMQLSATLLGGKLFQDLPSEKLGGIGHNQTSTRYEVSHYVSIEKGTRLHDILGEDRVLVNSFHHQAVKVVPDTATVCATADDGVIESIDFYPEYNILGVQWHPEALACNGRHPHTKIFDFILEEARLYRQARQLHLRSVVADSHTDTPMIFSGRGESYDFTKPAERALVDVPRMINGGLDVCTMVAYIPQGELTEEGRERAFKYADNTLKDIDHVMERAGVTVIDDTVSLIHKDKQYVIKGIENGYAIGQDFSKLDHFKSQNIAYMTLCHNGDNDICDSACKSSGTHNGLSEFGKQVVQKMNDLGITIDVSHASDKTIQDVLEVSTRPIIASHSSCRSLCSHARNISDDLIRKIAAKGGVIQACMYKGFVKEKSDEATILDFVNHILHIRELVGAEHTGIGTDFDGDGEVIGCRHTGQFIRITIELLRAGVPEEEVEKILGKNYLLLLSHNLV